MLNGSGARGEQTQSDGELASCERELIHLPGSIQPHGVLLVLDPAEWNVLQASENLEEITSLSATAALGCPLAEVLGPETAAALQAELAAHLPAAPAVPGPTAGPQSSAIEAAGRHTPPAFLQTVTIAAEGGGRRYHAIAHRADAAVVLEFERVAEEPDRPAAVGLHRRLDSFTLRVDAVESVDELSQIACDAIRQLTGFDRVLIYRFDEDWNGTVTGESGSGRLPSYRDHRFPASDIPAQARELYRVNRLRMIPDAHYRPVALTPPANPLTGQPLDMSFSTLRSVSPLHLEYMRNMETAASMSISILLGGRLWGLISCHHREPNTVPFPLRGDCDLFARIFSLRLSVLEHAHDYDHRIGVRSAFSRLLSAMTDRGDFAAALAENPQDLLAVAGARGAVLLTEEGYWSVGATPTEEQVRELARWLFESVSEDVFATDRLPTLFPASSAYKDTASGLVAAAISKIHPRYVLWFRPEVIRTISWGGDPRKPVAKPAESAGANSAGEEDTGAEPTRLHPRRSFATWRETVRDRAPAWSASELEGVTELRNAIVGTVLRKAEELASLNVELAHSNQELEAFSYSVSHDLRAPLRHIVGYAEMLREEGVETLSPRGRRCVDTIVESSEYAGRLVDKLLNYSRLGRSELQRSEIDMNLLLAEVRKDVMRDAEGREIHWRIAELPTLSADLMMLRMAVRDLLSNAVKYTRKREQAVIEIGHLEAADEHTFWVRDNGVGFSMEYAGKLFGVFQRLHRWEDYEGTGIGLANVRRVLERHGGRTWAEAEEERGATFFFALPKMPS